MTSPYSSEAAKSILQSYKRWAVVGCSPDPYKPANYVPAYLMDHGYEITPVNPSETEIFGLTCYPDLASIPDEADIEVVQIFRRSDAAAVHVDEAVAIGAKAVWMQLGVADEDAARRAQDAGLEVVMDRCPKLDIPRLLV
jgi:predicted CoA-binding protein